MEEDRDDETVSEPKQPDTEQLHPQEIISEYDYFLLFILNLFSWISSWWKSLRHHDSSRGRDPGLHCHSEKDTFQPQKDVLCSPCLRESIQFEATRCCRTCKDPEPLCELCAQRHTRKEENKRHEISDDLRKFTTSKTNSYKKDNFQPQGKVLCSLCLRESIQFEATRCCRTCKDPEPLCELCAQRHTRKEENNRHEISDDLRKFSILEVDVEKECNYRITSDDKVPGKPYATDVKSNSLMLCWDKPREKNDYFHIRYKPRNGHSKWKIVETYDDSNNINITEITPGTEYVFQVRGVFRDTEGPYGPYNDDITTMKSPAANILQLCEHTTSADPIRYHLPMKENKNARNETARTQQLVLGTPSQNVVEKSIMLVGATGSGKSTLVDGIINYIMGVNFDDTFRLTMVVSEGTGKKTSNEVQFGEKWTTVYKIYPQEGSLLDITINIIDTPGFIETNGIVQDNVIEEQIRQFFLAKGDQGISYIDAVCFVADGRLISYQKNIFSSILSLFGKDIESNICTLLTFSDGTTPAVLASLNGKSQLPSGKAFTFNNSSLFAENKKDVCDNLSPMFWKMGCNSYERFLKHILELETKSLCMTKTVLDKRNQLKTLIVKILDLVTEFTIMQKHE